VEPTLTRADRAHLETLDGKFRHARDVVKGVAGRFHTGMMLHGEGGTGKSYLVLEELRRLQTKYVLHNSRMTGRGLVDSLDRNRDDIHVLEDAETMFDDRRSWGVLRSALWSQSKKKPPEREVTWTAFRTQIRFVFTGGIIIISNSNLTEAIPEMRALKTRINVLGLDVTNDEMRALMKKICTGGYAYGEHFMTPGECWEVATYIIDRMEQLHRSLDLRLLMNGFRDRMQYKAGLSDSDWKLLLEGRIKERVVYKGRAEKKAEESDIALEIRGRGIPTREQIAMWKEKTGLGQAAYYRALRRAGKATA
jgi:hypothetical protein